MLTISEFARLGQVSPRMLRYYDENGLLTPARTDAGTGYRFYDVAQLGRLHRLVALRELGFALEQIRPVLEQDLAAGELRGMLRMRRAQIERNVTDEQARLRTIEAHLLALEREHSMDTRDFIIKPSEPVRVAEAVGVAAGYGLEHIPPVFQPLFRQVYDYLREAGVRPGMNIARYSDPAEDGGVTVHVGFDVGDQEVTESDQVRLVELPSVPVAAFVHHGTMEGIAPAFEALMHWTIDSGYSSAAPSRELYHHWDNDNPAGHVTELQLPLGHGRSAEGT